MYNDLMAMGLLGVAELKDTFTQSIMEDRVLCHLQKNELSKQNPEIVLHSSYIFS